MIVVGVGEPGATTRESRETTEELRPEPVQIVAAELVDGDQDDERGRGGGGAIRPGNGLGAGAWAAASAKE